jgi:tRNA G26 N,N-dimethylase Trm1
MKMPNEYKGKMLKSGGITLNQPRKWTEKEIEWCNDLKDKGYSIKEIANSIDRDILQVQIKMKRISKKENTYNQKHIEDKYFYNELFLNEIKPKNVLDLFSGAYSYYLDKVDEVYTNDIQTKFNTYYNEKAEKLVCKLYYENCSFDLIDIDPFGSAFDCFDLSIKMAKKGLVITFGEMGHLRFKRTDYVNKFYGIDTIEKFTIENLIEVVLKIGLRNRKKLTPIYVRNYQNISRVYFKVEKVKFSKDATL